MPVWLMVSVLLASASVAVAVNVSSTASSAPKALSGAVIDGNALGRARVPSVSNQSPGRPLTVPQGSAGSPRT